jgi:hypothetical protein
MSKVIIYQNGTDICVIHPAPGVTIERAMQDVPEGVEAQVVDAEKLPSDRYFRRAWKLGTSGVEVDVQAAKEVQRDVWRHMRKPKLEALDLEVMQAVEKGNTAKRRETADKKQELRDVTAIELPDDLESIRNTIPEILK